VPFAAKKPCAAVGCGRLVARGYCEACQAKGKGRDTRPSASRRLYGVAWRKASKGWLQHHPLCSGARNANGEQLTTHGEVIVAATCVDHVEPHKGDTTLFWDSGNWQGLCSGCHSIKTAREDGGFGRAGRAVSAAVGLEG
jgi:5-methylcytosine-specific restriction protein A